MHSGLAHCNSCVSLHLSLLVACVFLFEGMIFGRFCSMDLLPPLPHCSMPTFNACCFTLFPLRAAIRTFIQRRAVHLMTS